MTFISIKLLKFSHKISFRGNDYYWKHCRNTRILLEITSWICNNDLSAFLRVLGKDLSDGAPTPFEDRSFYFVLCHLEDKYRTGDCICQYHYRIYVQKVCLYFMVIMEIDVKNYQYKFLHHTGSFDFCIYVFI